MSKFHVGDRWEDNLGNEWAIIHVGVPVESYPLRVSVCGVDASNFGTVKDLQGEAVTHSLVHRVSPWRSLKDYSAPEDIDAMILLRRTDAWMLCGPLGRKRTIELAMANGFDEYMEVPE